MGRLPKADKLAALLETMTQADVARAFDVYPSTVSRAVDRHGIETIDTPVGGARRKSPLVPWRVAQEHAAQYPIKQLRGLGQRLAGEAVSPDNSRGLDAFINNMKANGWSVCYDREVGFYPVPKQPGDRNLIHYDGD